MEGVPTDMTHNFIADVRWRSTRLDGMQLAMRPFTVDGKGVAVIPYVQAVPQTPWPRIRASAPPNPGAETVPSPQLNRSQMYATEGVVHKATASLVDRLAKMNPRPVLEHSKYICISLCLFHLSVSFSCLFLSSNLYSSMYDTYSSFIQRRGISVPPSMITTNSKLLTAKRAYDKVRR
jgi:hypothetical protein